MPRAKHNKMARNIFALDEPAVLQPYVPKMVQTPRNDIVTNNFVQRIYTQE